MKPLKPPELYKDPDNGRQRFLLQLEFIQCLENPAFIHYLAQNRYFKDESFIRYLKYLQYWKRPEYIKFIGYPHCLFFLEQLQKEKFCNAMVHHANKEVAHRQQFNSWKYFRHNRLKYMLPTPEPLPEAAPAAAASAPPQQSLPPVRPLPAATISAKATSAPSFLDSILSSQRVLISRARFGPDLAKNDARMSKN